jgi:hypothetical protein
MPEVKERSHGKEFGMGLGLGILAMIIMFFSMMSGPNALTFGVIIIYAIGIIRWAVSRRGFLVLGMLAGAVAIPLLLVGSCFTMMAIG